MKGRAIKVDANYRLEERRAQEIAHWAQRRQNLGWQAIVVDAIQANQLRPCYEGKGDLYSENRQMFHNILRDAGGWEDRRVLDYGCGSGNWSAYYALTGAREVVAFDFNAVGIKIAKQLVAHHHLEDKVKLYVMDATALALASNQFDLVIGVGVLHHTIKYEGVFEELYRVMKPGGRAYFLENLSDFVLWRVWWWLHGERPEGDVPVFSRDLREKARMFSGLEIVGDTFIHSARTFVYKPQMGLWRRRLLRTTHGIDNMLFGAFPKLRNLGSFCYIMLQK